MEFFDYLLTLTSFFFNLKPNNQDIFPMVQDVRLVRLMRKSKTVLKTGDRQIYTITY